MNNHLLSSLSVCLSLPFFFFLFIHSLSLSLCLCLSIFLFNLFLNVSNSIYSTTITSLSLSLYLSLFLSLSFSLSLSLLLILKEISLFLSLSLSLSRLTFLLPYSPSLFFFLNFLTIYLFLFILQYFLSFFLSLFLSFFLKSLPSLSLSVSLPLCFFLASLPFLSSHLNLCLFSFFNTRQVGFDSRLKTSSGSVSKTRQNHWRVWFSLVVFGSLLLGIAHGESGLGEEIFEVMGRMPADCGARSAFGILMDENHRLGTPHEPNTAFYHSVHFDRSLEEGRGSLSDLISSARPFIYLGPSRVHGWQDSATCFLRLSLAPHPIQLHLCIPQGSPVHTESCVSMFDFCMHGPVKTYIYIYIYILYIYIYIYINIE